MKIREAVRQKLRVPLLLTALASFPMHVSAQDQPTLTVTVDCAAGQAIAHALRQGDERKPLVVILHGTCIENVTVDRDDVTLVADGPGGTVNGPDPNTSTVTVTGSRVTIDGVAVTGGRNGILGLGARALTVANCIVQNTGRTGIVFTQGTSGTVDTCTVHNNPRDGLAIESSSFIDPAPAAANVVTGNSGFGVNCTDGEASVVNTVADLARQQPGWCEPGVHGVLAASWF